MLRADTTTLLSTPMKFSSTISQLTLLGFILAMLPLVGAIIHTYWQVDKLAGTMHSMVSDSTEASEAGRMIQSKLISAERSAGQYLVLSEKELFDRYKDQRIQLIQAIQHLRSLNLSEEIGNRLEQLQTSEQVLYDKLQHIEEASPEQVQQLTHNIRLLANIAQPLPLEVSYAITNRRQVLDQNVTDIQRLLLWQVLALVPLAMLLGIVISILLNRPMKRLKNAIHRLGDGELTTPVVVSGPQDIHDLGQRLDWLRQRLAELDEQKLTFLQHVSHELKTPLTGIREGTELLLDGVTGKLRGEQAEVVEIIRDSSLQLQAQVEALLGFNSALLQKSPSRNERLRIDLLLDDVIEQHQLAARSRQIDMLAQIEIAVTRGDREQLRVLSGTILSNAIKFSPLGGTIHIKLRQMRQKVIIDIIDAGPGVHGEDQKQIFEPFFQGRNTPKSHVKGTGLGLAIASRYARLHHGQVLLQQSKKGAHFRIILPAEEINRADKRTRETAKLEKQV
ncbi:MAG TPA: HAMP domain-containing protein [Crenotrichaceae bacterium]|nr:HAMP domain-containing protein [Crenotrichaceae bacterium]